MWFEVYFGLWIDLASIITNDNWFAQVFKNCDEQGDFGKEILTKFDFTCRMIWKVRCELGNWRKNVAGSLSY